MQPYYKCRLRTILSRRSVLREGICGIVFFSAKAAKEVGEGFGEFGDAGYAEDEEVDAYATGGLQQKDEGVTDETLCHRIDCAEIGEDIGSCFQYA